MVIVFRYIGKVLLERANYLYKHRIRNYINVVTKITILVCDISLQFDCNFIDTYKPSILVLRKISLIKLLMTLLAIAATILKLQELIRDYNRYSRTEKDELTHNQLKAQILKSVVDLIRSIIDILIILKVIALLGKKAGAVSLLPVILFITISQPINLYFTHIEYSNTKDCCKFHKHGWEIATLALTIVSFVLNDVVKTQDIPIVLSPNLIYTLNYGALASMMCTLISIFSTLDLLYLDERSLDQSSSHDQPPGQMFDSNIEEPFIEEPFDHNLLFDNNLSIIL